MSFTPEIKTTGLKVKVACHHFVGGNRGNHEGEVYFEGGHSLFFSFLIILINGLVCIVTMGKYLHSAYMEKTT